MTRWVLLSVAFTAAAAAGSAWYARPALDNLPDRARRVIAINEGPLLALARTQPGSLFARAVPLLHNSQRGIVSPHSDDDPHSHCDDDANGDTHPHRNAHAHRHTDTQRNGDRNQSNSEGSS